MNLRPDLTSRMVTPRYSLYCSLLGGLLCGLVSFAEAAHPALGTVFLTPRGEIVEDFESGEVELIGYPDQDHDPDAWQLVSDLTFGDSQYALRLFGNSWKMQEITARSVADSTVWQVAIYTEKMGEMHAFGVGDGQNELFYTMHGEDLPESTNWWTVYQGAFPQKQWYAYLLPIGDDWLTTFGYLPTLTHLIYVNDDDQGPPGITYFDAIVDVTEDQPVAPRCNILYTVESSEKIARKLYRLGVQFQGTVFDPDSDSHTFAWDFGDSTTSDEQNPTHEFLVHADYPYTVGLVVTDPTGLAAGDNRRRERTGVVHEQIADLDIGGSRDVPDLQGAKRPRTLGDRAHTIAIDLHGNRVCGIGNKQRAG